MDIKENLLRVNERIEKALARAGKTKKDLTVLAVTKTVEVLRIKEYMEYGGSLLGENYVQELISKYDAVKGADWHFIGHLQTNKVKYIIDKVKLIQSVDSVRLMAEIDKQAQKLGICANILLEINIGEESTKSGIGEEKIDEFCGIAREFTGINLCGLMCIPPNAPEMIENVKNFERMYRIFIDNKTKFNNNGFINSENQLYLSMGMSSDFEAAIECGSNMIRLGAAIFGNRK